MSRQAGVVSGQSGWSRATGTEVEIRAGEYAARVTSLGATLRTLRLGARELVDGFEAGALPDSGRGQLLAPWPNRLRDGAWQWEGEALRLPIDTPERGNSASHGLVRWLEWHVASRSDASVEWRVTLGAQPGYPFRLELSATYSVDPVLGLSARLEARNVGDGAAPVALGTHPYLLPLGGDLEQATLVLPAAEHAVLDAAGIPERVGSVDGTGFDFRAGRPLRSVALNDAFTGLIRGHASATASVRDALGEVRLHAGSGSNWLQVYTGDALDGPKRRRSIAIEPMTAPAGALASGRDLVVLERGASTRLEWRIDAEPDHEVAG